MLKANRIFHFLLFAALSWFVASVNQRDIAAAEIDAPPAPGIKTRPIDVQWEYSTDCGRTFDSKPPAGAPPMMKTGIAPRAFRGTFEIADPKTIAGLWVRLAAKQSAPSKPAICNGDLVEAAGGYWKDLGHCPTLLNAKASLNGKPIAMTHGPMLYFWLPIEELPVQGKNTIDLSGDCYTYWGSEAAESLTAELVAADPQPPVIDHGPVLGDFGDDYFTISCRTQPPAELFVNVIPHKPDGVNVVVKSPRSLWHRAKIAVPVGTKEVTYSLQAKIGAHEGNKAPYTMAFPGAEYRFVAMGNLLSHNIQVDRLKMISQRVTDSIKPAFIVNTGNVSEHGSWDHDWERRFFDPAFRMVGSIPTFVTPGSRDFAGIIQEMHYTPAKDTYSHTWSKAIGPVRFIGIDGGQTWAADGENTKWLEEELKNAKEKYVFALNAYPAFSSGRNSKKPYPVLVQSREVIMPLLAKYKATAMLSGDDPDYERCEPTPDKGVTQIVIGNSGKDSYRFSGGGYALNPFNKDKAVAWAGAEMVRAILIFDVKADSVEMKCVEMSDDAQQMAEKEFNILDRKTFRPREGK